MKTDSPNYYRGVINQEDILALTNTILAGIPYGIKTHFDNPQMQTPTITGFNMTDSIDYSNCYGAGNMSSCTHPISGKFTNGLVALYGMTKGINQMGEYGEVRVNYGKYLYPLIEYQYNTNPDENGEEIGWENYILKPYLIPMTAMSKEDKREYLNLKFFLDKSALCADWMHALQWVRRKHYDFDGLIQKGLAHDVTKQPNFIYENT